MWTAPALRNTATISNSSEAGPFPASTSPEIVYQLCSASPISLELATRNSHRVPLAGAGVERRGGSGVDEERGSLPPPSVGELASARFKRRFRSAQMLSALSGLSACRYTVCTAHLGAS